MEQRDRLKTILLGFEPLPPDYLLDALRQVVQPAAHNGQFCGTRKGSQLWHAEGVSIVARGRGLNCGPQSELWWP